jgi:hypothetical protein
LGLWHRYVSAPWYLEGISKSLSADAAPTCCLFLPKGQTVFGHACAPLLRHNITGSSALTPGDLEVAMHNAKRLRGKLVSVPMNEQEVPWCNDVLASWQRSCLPFVPFATALYPSSLHRGTCYVLRAAAAQRQGCVCVPAVQH